MGLANYVCTCCDFFILINIYNVSQLISELCRIIKSPAVLDNYKSKWASMWLPKFIAIGLAKNSQVAAVWKSAAEAKLDGLEGHKCMIKFNCSLR